MKDNLRNKAISGFAWRAIERYSVQAARFCVSIILARILSPHEFGLIALVMVFISFGQVLIDGGFSNALVQGEHVDDKVCDSVFFCNLGVGLLCATLLFLSAPLVAGFYHEPELRRIIPTLSLNFIISSCGLVYSALLAKRLQFKSLAMVSIISTAISGTVGVLMALNQFGVWSLVGQALTDQLVQLFCVWFFTHWRPRALFEWAAVKMVAPFGLRVLFATIAESLYQNSNVIIIGKLFTPTTLGYYSRADSMWSMTMSNFSSVLSSVAFPVMASIKNSPERLRRAMKDAVEILAFVSYPAAVGLVAVAHPLVLALLTSKWEPCVPFLQLLGGIWVLYPMHAINGSVILAQGEGKLYLRLILLQKVICLAVLPLLFLGIYPFILSRIAVGLAAYYLNCSCTGKLIGYSMGAQLRDSFPYIMCAILMGLCIQLVRFLHLSQPLLELILQVGLGIVCYLSFCLLFRLAALTKAREIIHNLLMRSRQSKGMAASPVL